MGEEEAGEGGAVDTTGVGEGEGELMGRDGREGGRVDVGEADRGVFDGLLVGVG